MLTPTSCAVGLGGLLGCTSSTFIQTLSLYNTAIHHFDNIFSKNQSLSTSKVVRLVKPLQFSLVLRGAGDTVPFSEACQGPVSSISFFEALFKETLN